MKKKLSLLLVVIILFCGFSSVALAANVGVSIDNVPVKFTADSGYPFVDKNNRTLVPLRGAMESYGCAVSWDGSAKTAVVSKGNTVVKVPVGVSYLYVNGNKVTNDTAAVTQNGRVYLPIRIVLEAFGADVSWDNNTATVIVTSAGGGNAKLQVHFIDVGQADSVLIDYNQYEVLIDGGNNSDGVKVCNYINKYVDGKLDLLIATHADADHIGGLDDVIKKYQVGTIIDSGQTKDTATYKDYWSAAQAEQGCKLLYDSDMVINIGNNAYLKIIETGDNYNKTNNNSVVSMLVYDNTKVLFTGDMESEVEKINLTKFSDVDVLKAGHHGSASSSSKEFLQKVKPEYVVVSAGLGNSYGHPAAATLNNYFNINAKVLATFKSGNIIMTCNGRNYSFNSNAYLTINDAGNKTGGNTNGNINGSTNGNTNSNVGSAKYVGNKNTKKFHYVTCGYAKQISSANRVYFNSRAEAVGYVPCKVCNP